MASAFGHAAASLGISTWNRPLVRSPKFWVCMAVSAVLPDIDAIGYYWGIPYDSMYGHRGFTHSVLFAVLWSAVLGFVVFRKNFKSAWTYLFLATLSHGLIDACTNGGHGVGFFIPWSETRYFFPIHPILVSPMNVRSFFSARGLMILGSEAFWIGIPTLISILWSRFSHRTVK